MALWFVNSALAVRVVKATAARLGALAAAADGPVPPEVEALRSSARWARADEILIADDLALLVLMYAQPGLLASVAVTAAVNAAVIGLFALRARRSAAPPGRRPERRLTGAGKERPRSPDEVSGAQMVTRTGFEPMFSA